MRTPSLRVSGDQKVRPMMYVRNPRVPPTKVPRIRSAPVCATFPMTCKTKL